MPEEIFNRVEEHIVEAYRELTKLMIDDGSGLDGKGSVWSTLYGAETEQTIIKLREALMWLEAARLSVG